MMPANAAAKPATSLIPSPLPRGSGSASGGPCASSNGVRFTLRKRSNPSDREPQLSSYNSDFLSGLFADVAKANVLSEFNIPQTDAETTASPPSRMVEDLPRPFKKSRLSLSSCRSRASCMNLATMEVDLQSPKRVCEISSVQKTEKTVVSPHPTEKTCAFGPSSCAIPKQDSLSVQLGLLEGKDYSASSADPTKTTAFKDAAMLAFPNLPATISENSYSTGLTRESLALHVPSSETATESSGASSSFGWFVDLDDGDHRDLPCSGSKTAALTHAVSTDNLAFHAPTAPKRTSDDSEIEWAQAADTVDSVLGDLF